MADARRVVVGGVDTHKDVHVAAVIDGQGKILGTSEFKTTAGGYRGLLAWMRSFGELVRVGVEGSSSYGAALTRYLVGHGVGVLEVHRPNRQTRRLRGKSDTVDAEAAARAVLSGEARVTPKSQDGIVESIRALRVAFVSARKSRAGVIHQIGDLVISAPGDLRSALGSLSRSELVSRCARFRAGGDPADPVEGTKHALRALARRYEALSVEMDDLGGILDALTAKANPALRGAQGVGPDVAAILLVAAGDNPGRLTSESAFAAMCGVSPVPASSGKTVRHRLNRSGNRQANHALWRIAMVRLTCDPQTKEYLARRTAEGKTKREIMRCLKRYIAREVFGHLTNPATVPAGSHLRIARQNANLSLRTIATALETWPLRISQIERGIKHDTHLTRRYQALLTTDHAT
jgi:transposase